MVSIEIILRRLFFVIIYFIITNIRSIEFTMNSKISQMFISYENSVTYLDFSYFCCFGT